MSEQNPSRHDPYAALRIADFRNFTLARFAIVFAEQMALVAVGWELYERTNSALALGLIGLVQVIPAIFLAPFAGDFADRFSRKRVTLVTQLALIVATFGLMLLSLYQGPIWMVYVLLFALGVSYTFGNPAIAAFNGQLVPPELYTNAATWGSTSWQVSSIFGPTLGGLLLALSGSAALVYGIYVILSLGCVVLILRIADRPIQREKHEPMSWASLALGFRFLWRNPILLGAVSMDMFSVLLGGAVALLPIYARDILFVGPEALGIMRAMPSIGALVVAFIVAHRPPFTQAGRTLLWAVAGFGMATIIFGFSTNLWLSLAMLALLGALDNVSVIIRGSLLLSMTPDALRGRVSAANYVFIGMSNELGAFESGAVAALFGAVVSAVSGGVGTLVVVGLVAWLVPGLRRLKRLEDVNPNHDALATA